MYISKKSLCLFACLILGISVFFPYIYSSFLGSTVSINLIDLYEGKFLLGIVVLDVILLFSWRFFPSIIIGGISLVLFFLENNAIATRLENENALTKALFQNGAGYYMLLIGSILLIVFSLMGYSEERIAALSQGVEEDEESTNSQSDIK